MTDCAVCARELDGGNVCRPCRGRIESRLRDIPGLYDQVEVEACLSTPPPSERTKQSRTAPMPLSLNLLAALLLRTPTGLTFTHPVTGQTEAGYHDLLEALEGWCRTVAEARRLSPSQLPETYRGRVAFTARFLLTHVEWLCDQPYIKEVAFAVNATFRLLKQASAPDREYAPTQIPCTGETDVPCSGKYSQEAATGALVCRRCGQRWEPPAFWLMAERQSRPVPVADVAAWCGVPEGTIRSWLSRGQLPNYGSEQRPRVLMGDVLTAKKSA